MLLKICFCPSKVLGAAGAEGDYPSFGEWEMGMDVDETLGEIFANPAELLTKDVQVKVIRNAFCVCARRPPKIG